MTNPIFFVGIRIDTDASITPLFSETEGYPGLKVLQDAVAVGDNHNIEIIPTFWKEDVPTTEFTAWCNEDGLYVEANWNPIAEKLFDLSIRGPIAITGGVDDEGETLALDPDLMERFVGTIMTWWTD